MRPHQQPQFVIPQVLLMMAMEFSGSLYSYLLLRGVERCGGRKGMLCGPESEVTGVE